MAFKERAYQARVDAEICAAWAAGHRNVMAVMPTGAGKTVLVSNIVGRERDASVFVAHRQELVSQASLTFARNNIRHRVVAPLSVQRTCAAIHMMELGRCFVDPSAPAAVAGVDTLLRHDKKDPWLQRVKLAVTDEGHHVLRDNKWGRGLSLFPNARGLMVTATPARADGKGLGRHADGLVDCLVQGPGMRELIDLGYLTDYRIFAPPSDLDLSDVAISAGGDFAPDARAKAVKKSHITGDVVEHYLRIAPGKLAVCFANDIEHATAVTAAMRVAGVLAEMVTGDTPDSMRAQILRRFRERQVTVLVNVDLFGEGFDLPAVEVVIMARPTMSWALYCQQFGRMLRILDGKKWGLLIDHVGNVERHAKTRGLPDTPQNYNLDRREKAPKGAPSDAVPQRVCLNMHVGGQMVDGEMVGGEPCMSSYERVLDACPYCGHVPEVAGRSSPAQVEGVLHELDPEVLRRMRGEADAVMGPAPMQGASYAIAKAAHRNHVEKQAAQNDLRAALALWGGWQVALGRSETEAQRRFWHRYNTTGLDAAALGPAEARALEAHIRAELEQHNVRAQDAA